MLLGSHVHAPSIVRSCEPIHTRLDTRLLSVGIDASAAALSAASKMTASPRPWDWHAASALSNVSFVLKNLYSHGARSEIVPGTFGDGRLGRGAEGGGQLAFAIRVMNPDVPEHAEPWRLEMRQIGLLCQLAQDVPAGFHRLTPRQVEGGGQLAYDNVGGDVTSGVLRHEYRTS